MSKVVFASGWGAVPCARAPAGDPASMAASSAPSAVARLTLLSPMCFLPGADLAAPFVEDPLIVALAHLEARLGRELTEDRRPHVEHREVRRGTSGRHRVGPEEETV